MTQLKMPNQIDCQATIESGDAGTILRDFEALLEFVGVNGVRSTGKYHLLPMAGLFDLDERMTRPLRPPLKRPQLKSFPYLNGLYMLARATELIVARGSGDTKGSIAVDPEVLGSWRTLNSTEKYFTLLEAWFLFSSWEMVGGETRGGWMGRHGMADDAMELWRRVKEPRVLAESSRGYNHVFHGWEGATTMALFELFGFMQVDLGAHQKGVLLPVRAVCRTDFGREMISTLQRKGTLRNFFELELELEVASEIDDPADPPTGFGQWHARLKTIFPQWKNNLVLPVPEFREGIYVFQVSLGKPWRKIAIVADADLEELAGAIISAFGFDGNHLYDFEARNRDGTSLRISCSRVEEAEALMDDFAVGYLPLLENDTMRFNYDYGAGWQFDMKLERVNPDDENFGPPKVIASKGKAPAEYPSYDDEEW